MSEARKNLHETAEENFVRDLKSFVNRIDRIEECDFEWLKLDKKQEKHLKAQVGIFKAQAEISKLYIDSIKNMQKEYTKW